MRARQMASPKCDDAHCDTAQGAREKILLSALRFHTPSVGSGRYDGSEAFLLVEFLRETITYIIGSNMIAAGDAYNRFSRNSPTDFALLPKTQNIENKPPAT